MTPFGVSAAIIVFILSFLVISGLLKWFYESLKRKRTTKEIAKMLLVPVCVVIALVGIKIIYNNKASTIRQNPPSSDIRMLVSHTSDFVSNSRYISGSTTKEYSSIYIDG